MKKILFPTDFSENSLHAFGYALQLAKKLGAEIITLHVYPEDVLPYSEYAPFLAQNYNIAEWGNLKIIKAKSPNSSNSQKNTSPLRSQSFACAGAR
jgi:nucleotide-binding universal stress UspA family protein